MPYPSELDHLPLQQLVEKANDEIRRLCCGPRHEDGRAWTMCIPAQASDSDLILSAAVNRQAKEIETLQQSCYAIGEQLRAAREYHGRAHELADGLKGIVQDIRSVLEKGRRPAGIKLVTAIELLVEELHQAQTALVELVALKDLKEHAEHAGNTGLTTLRDQQMAAYRERQPKAWAAARAAIAKKGG